MDCGSSESRIRGRNGGFGISWTEVPIHGEVEASGAGRTRQGAAAIPRQADARRPACNGPAGP
jgi:hypothetical protein